MSKRHVVIHNIVAERPALSPEQAARLKKRLRRARIRDFVERIVLDVVFALLISLVVTAGAALMLHLWHAK